MNGDRQKSLLTYGLREELPVLALLGGSQGAQALNKAMENALKNFTDIQILWQTGDSHLEAYRKHETDRVKVMPFVDDMGTFYAAADLIISRAGALALAEIAACGKPSLLIPFAGSAGNHQTMNAESLRASGAAIVVHQKEFTGKRLTDEVKQLMGNNQTLSRMASAALSVAKPEAVDLIVNEIEVIAEA